MGAYDNIAILIPAYKPDGLLNDFIRNLKAVGFSRILVVDDGGGPDYARFFDEAREQGAEVLTHEVNKGKGVALKTGLLSILNGGAVPVITADSDGQHAPDCCRRVADALLLSPDSLVLGMREKSAMPPRSRTGNTITCIALGMLTGLWIGDTQTGLRGLPAKSLDGFAQLDGDRYEYEMNMLIAARQQNMPILELPIATIYIDANKGSHFDSVKDGYRIYSLLFKQIGKYIGSSLVSGIIEYAVFIALMLYRPEPAIISIVGARVISSAVNYIVNRDMVFKSHAGKRSIVYFYLLVSAVLFMNYWIIRFLEMVSVPRLIAKIIADLLLFVLSYNVQQRFIFRDRSGEEHV